MQLECAALKLHRVIRLSLRPDPAKSMCLNPAADSGSLAARYVCLLRLGLEVHSHGGPRQCTYKQVACDRGNGTSRALCHTERWIWQHAWNWLSPPQTTQAHAFSELAVSNAVAASLQLQKCSVGLELALRTA